jgi:hypothetical protein
MFLGMPPQSSSQPRKILRALSVLITLALLGALGVVFALDVADGIAHAPGLGRDHSPYSGWLALLLVLFLVSLLIVAPMAWFSRRVVTSGEGGKESGPSQPELPRASIRERD